MNRITRLFSWLLLIALFSMPATAMNKNEDKVFCEAADSDDIECGNSCLFVSTNPLDIDEENLVRCDPQDPEQKLAHCMTFFTCMTALFCLCPISF